MERGREKTDYSWKEVGEKPGGLAQERAFGFHPSKLLKKREGDDLGVRELLQGLVVPTVRIQEG
jgi:hypothetical protein